MSRDREAIFDREVAERRALAQDRSEWLRRYRALAAEARSGRTGARRVTGRAHIESRLVGVALPLALVALYGVAFGARAVAHLRRRA